ncbi:MAG: leucine-rich repeat domain-containing protein [Nostoc sp.]|uniref:leucine-rich repeat domain-containing protein n=1 Tax=Nostoc sp. TaxID=1180 RepID=UPI002FF8913D
MTNEELLEIIQKAVRDKVTELDFSFKSLTTLPAEIGRLTNLRSLDLRFNQLSSLPPQIAQFTNLLKDMNTLTPDIHSKSGFEELLNAIAHRLDE